ncbi:MAG: biopolymer transporter ExbD [Flavobacteriaceae bacterium]|nr:biopolymer transporter ExbD [Flavobacteriaceae bacterium]
MKHSQQAPQVNAGSMADIAFLLLIFFLVTAMIPNDQGINRKLPRLCPPGQKCNVDIHERNMLKIVLNGNQEIMVNEDIVSIEEVKELSKKFLDNNGDKSCDYCKGSSLPEASDNPTKAVISLQVDKKTHYSLFIKVQDELTKAYYELRASYAQKSFNKTPNELTVEELKIVREAYPFLVSEADTK